MFNLLVMWLFVGGVNSIALYGLTSYGSLASVPGFLACLGILVSIVGLADLIGFASMGKDGYQVMTIERMIGEG